MNVMLKTLCYSIGMVLLLSVVGCAVLFPTHGGTMQGPLIEEIPDELIQLEPAQDYREWTRFEDSEYGFTISHPPRWTARRTSAVDWLSIVTFVPPEHPQSAVTVRVVAGTDIVDEFDLSASPLGKIVEYHLLQQGDRFASKMITQKLTGEAVTVESDTTKTEYAIFKHQGKSYIIGIEYSMNQQDQELMNLFYTMVEGFRLE